jgi:16S rRNA processing protein RimM
LTSDSDLNPETAVTVGRITAAHGIRGEIKVEPLTDFPERFQPGSRLWIDGTPYEVERGRWQGRSVVLKLSGVDTRNEAEALPGKQLLAPEATEIEEEDTYYLHDVIGLRVEDAAGETLGELAEVLSTGSNDVYVVRGERGELLLPALDDVVRQVDIPGGRIVVDVPEGIEFARAAQPRNRRGGKGAANR